MAYVLAALIFAVVAAAVFLEIMLRLLFQIGLNRVKPDKRTRKRKREDTPSEAALARRARNREGIAWVEAQSSEKLSLQSADGLTLRACLIAGEHPKRFAVCVHGWKGRREDMGVFAQMYHEMGFSVLLPDLRGHGCSQGAYMTFGWPDHYDILRWVHLLIKQYGAEEIVAHGVSMGAATVMLLTGEPLPEQIKCVVEDCGFTDTQSQFIHTIGSMFKWMPVWLRKTLFTLADRRLRRRTGYGLSESDCVAAVRRSVTPTLFIHGQKDTFVPFDMVKKVYAACSADKALFTVPDAVHAASFFFDEFGYGQSVYDFIKQYINMEE